jgi:kynurenine formamidase
VTNASDQLLAGIRSGRTRLIDLTYRVSPDLVPWPGDQRWFEAKVHARIAEDGYFSRSFWMLEHCGTHLDAPAHFAPGKATVDQIPAERFFAPAVLFDVQREGATNADYQLPGEAVLQWEHRHGRIPEGAVALLRTGWAKYWPDAQRYRNLDAAQRMHFPGFSLAAAELLIERKVSGLGCDTMSVEYGATEDFALHRLTLDSGLYHLENLGDLSNLPESGAYLVVAPIKLEGGSGGPVRVFALLDESCGGP